MTIIEVKLKKDTEKYKFFSVHYTPWWNSNSIKFRNGFIMKETDDCFWGDNGKRLNAWTERAVLACIDDIESENLINIQNIGRVHRPTSKLGSILDNLILTDNKP